MANYYTKFCVALPKGDEILNATKAVIFEIATYFEGEDHGVSENMITALENNGCEDELGFDVDFEGENFDIVMISSDENGQVEVAAVLISDILEAANSDEVIILNYAFTASRALVGGFGGGSAVISRKEVKYVVPEDIARGIAEELKQDLAVSPAP